MSETGQPYAFTEDDPLNETDPLGLIIPGGPGGCPGPNAACSAKTGPTSSAAPGRSVVSGTPTYLCSENGKQVILAGCALVGATHGSVVGPGNEPEPVNPSFENPATPPGPGFSWQGPGAVGSSRGAWLDTNLGLKLHPDFAHLGDVAPHYDVKLPDGSQWRWYQGNWFQLKGPGQGNPLTQQELNEFLNLNLTPAPEPDECETCDPTASPSVGE